MLKQPKEYLNFLIEFSVTGLVLFRQTNLFKESMQSCFMPEFTAMIFIVINAILRYVMPYRVQIVLYRQGTS
jgi:hypothetical protein